MRVAAERHSISFSATNLMYRVRLRTAVSVLFAVTVTTPMHLSLSAQARAFSNVSYRVATTGTAPELTVYWTQNFRVAAEKLQYRARVRAENGREDVPVPKVEVDSSPPDEGQRSGRLSFPVRPDGMLAQNSNQFLAVLLCTYACDADSTTTSELIVDLSVVRGLLAAVRQSQSLQRQLQQQSDKTLPQLPQERDVELRASVTPLANEVIATLSTASQPVEVIVEAWQNGAVRSSSSPIVLYPNSGVSAAEPVRLSGLYSSTEVEIQVHPTLAWWKRPNPPVLLRVTKDFEDKPLKTIERLLLPSVSFLNGPKVTVQPRSITVDVVPKNITSFSYVVERFDRQRGLPTERVGSSVVPAGALKSDGSTTLRIPHAVSGPGDFRLTLTGQREYGPSAAPTQVEKSDAIYVVFSGIQPDFVKAIQVVFEPTGISFTAKSSGVPAVLFVSPSLDSVSSLVVNSGQSMIDPKKKIDLGPLLAWWPTARGSDGLMRFRVRVEARDSSERVFESAVELGAQLGAGEKAAAFVAEVKKVVLNQPHDDGKKIALKDIVKTGVPLLMQLLIP